MRSLLRKGFALTLAAATLLMGMQSALAGLIREGRTETVVVAAAPGSGFAGEVCGEAAEEEDRHEDSKWRVNLFAAAVDRPPRPAITGSVDPQAGQAGSVGRLVNRSIRGPPAA